MHVRTSWYKLFEVKEHVVQLIVILINTPCPEKVATIFLPLTLAKLEAKVEWHFFRVEFYLGENVK